MIQRNALTLVSGGRTTPDTFRWFCGHCAAPSPGGVAPPPTARVCARCGLGLLLETREDAVPDARDAFLVVDSRLLVQAMSREAQVLLGLAEEDAVDHPVAELLVPADAEGAARGGLAAAIADAAAGDEPEGRRIYIRPWNTFGVRMRARISTCGPPRAALIVLDSGRGPSLRAIQGERDNEQPRLGTVTELRRRH
ncbi:MAG TPA: PAS domain-containing protein [Solirubrobacteraceae bacterium]|nr:PAS domain-containing protein [Solirubrobacteraceae bacterium]